MLGASKERRSSMESFRECGWPAFGALGIGIFATLIAVVALAMALAKVRAGVFIGVAALAIALGAPGAGIFGMYYGRQVVDDALRGPVVTPEFREQIRETGYAEAAQCVPVGATIGMLPMLLAGIAIAVGLMKKPEEKTV